LFEKYINELKQNNNEIKIMTVNSSFYGEKIYKKLGFIKTEEAQEKNGIKYIPMKYEIKK
jgi:predicted GNAT family N-acyltransferase